MTDSVDKLLSNMVNGDNNKAKIKRVGPPGTFEWVYNMNPEVQEALYRMNDAIAKARQGHGEYVAEMQTAFAGYVKKFGNTIVKEYKARDIRANRSITGIVKVNI